MSGAPRSTDRPLAFWLTDLADGPEPWSAPGERDTIPAPPPTPGRYSIIAPRGAAPPPPSRVRACRPASRTDPCITPLLGSDRRGPRVEVVEAGAGGRAALLPPPWAPVRGSGGQQ